MYTGPLGAHVDEFADRVQLRGYSKRSIRTKLRVIASFSRWLAVRDLAAHDVDAVQQKRFLTYRKRTGGWSSQDAAALREMEALLCEKGITSDAEASMELSARERMELDFQVFLSQDRGLASVTVKNYLRVVSYFLKECFVDDTVRTELLTSTDVIGFVQRHAHSHGCSWAQSMVTALRAFLRYLGRHGKIPADLAACVPAVAAWSFARLPAFLSPEETQQVLAGCNRQTAIGRRDYAMLLLCARLGLRAGEVAALRLDEIDWGNGCLAIRSKGGRWTQMPLPHEVGEAIADYLTDGRPSCRDRHVFIRAHAPYKGFGNSSSVSAVASQALVRAAIVSPRKGAHLFRHTLATQLLGQGASLAQIGQLLRHQHPDTTRIYAKVDLAALRKLAPPWPGGAR
jgi:site-specific recombinase XerD